MEANPYYLDRNGKMIHYDSLFSHIGIALKYLEDNPDLMEEFKRSGMKYPTDFLVEKLGFIQVTDEQGNGYYNNKVVFSASMMTPYQKGVIMQYIADGYEADNVDRASNSVAKRFHNLDR